MILWFYVPFTGAQPPVIRAAVMVSLGIGAFLLRRPKRLFYSLLLAYIALLFWRPEGLRDAGFQLSFAGTAGTLYAVSSFGSLRSRNPLKRFHRSLRPPVRLVQYALHLLIISVAAWVATAPIIIWYFGRLPIFGPLVTLPALMILYFALTAGWLMVLFAWFPLVGDVYGAAFHGLLWLLERIAVFSSAKLPSLDFLSVRAAIIAFLSASVLAFLIPRIRRAPIPGSLIAVLSVGVIIVYGSLWLPAREIKAAILDVGSGDGVLLRRGERAVLIDGGSAYSNAMRRQLRLNGLRRVDLLVLTHGDADHCSAVRDLLPRTSTGAALIGPGVLRDEAGRKTVTALFDNSVPVFVGNPGTVVDLGRLGTIEVLSPASGSKPMRDHDNDLSLVLLWRVGEASALFPGDISSRVEERLLAEGLIPEVDFLLTAHHGSRFSTSSGWIDKLSPDFAVISCAGNNLYGHPSDEVLAVLNQAGVGICRTDLEGAVIIGYNGSEFERMPWNQWW